MIRISTLSIEYDVSGLFFPNRFKSYSFPVGYSPQTFFPYTQFYTTTFKRNIMYNIVVFQQGCYYYFIWKNKTKICL